VSNINFVTPSPWVDHIIKSLDIAWGRGLFLPTVYNCGGYEKVETIKSLRGYVGIYMPDFKYMDPKLSKRYSFAPDYPEIAKKALYEMVNQRGDAHYDSDGMMIKGVIVRHLVLPSHTEDSMRILEYLKHEYGDSIVISIMSQYTPMPNMSPPLDRRVTDEEYRSVVEYAEAIGITNAFIQDGGAALESFIPDFSI
jgi:putative pyruvate formate lyase activating enzyme